MDSKSVKPKTDERGGGRGRAANAVVSRGIGVGHPLTRARQARVLLERMEVESGATSDCSLITVSSDASLGRKRHVRRSSESSEEEISPRPSAPRRGRPPTTGEYVGLAQAKKEYVAQQREEMRVQAQKELQDELRQTKVEVRSPAQSLDTSADEEGYFNSLTVADLKKKAVAEADIIGTIAKKSRNLKSNFVRDLRVSANSLVGIVDTLGSRTESVEVGRLTVANAKLQAELASVRKELVSLRADMERLRAQQAASSPQESNPVAGAHVVPGESGHKRRRVQLEKAPAPTLEEVCSAVMGRIGDLLDARLAPLPDEPPRERTTRDPPVSEGPANSARPAAAGPAPVPASAPKAPGESRKAKRSKKGKKEEERFVPAPPPPPQTEAWNAVTRKRTKRKETSTQPPRQPQPQQTRPQQSGQQQRQSKTRKRKRKLRSARTAAVVVTLIPGAEASGASYAAVMADARRKMGEDVLLELGIGPGLRMRRSATGARMFEVAGANRAELADSLAAKLREALDGGVARVHRPYLTAEMRVSGLDDSVTAEEVSSAVARVGGCPVDQVRTGAVTVGPNGLGVAWIRLPVAAAKKVVDGGRLLVGWVSAQVKLLEPRPKRCFRCLEVGHLRAHCVSEVDRSMDCHRCGQPGHKAQGCDAPAHCKECSAAGKPANHRAGGKACAPPPKGRKTGRRSGGGPRANTKTSPPDAGAGANAKEAEEMAEG